MPSGPLWFEKPDDELRDDEYPDEASLDEESSETVPCPECGSDVYEDAPQCPVCGTYITSASGNVWSGRPGWWVFLGLLGILALILALAVF